MKNKAVEKLIDELIGCFEDFGRISLIDRQNVEILCEKYETKLLMELLAEKINKSKIKESVYDEEETIVAGDVLGTALIMILEIIAFLNKDDNEINSNVVFGNFSLLCNIMEIFNFKMKEKVDVISYVINRNINSVMTVPDGENIYFTLDNILNVKEDFSVSITEFMKLIATKGFFGKVRKNRFYRLTSNGQKNIRLLQEFASFSRAELKKFLEQLEIIHIEYILKKEPSSLEKVDEIYQAFINLGIDKNICDYLKQKMLEDVKNRELLKSFANTDRSKEKEETYSTDYYYSILNSLYDFKNSMPKKYIYPNEMRTIAFVMKKLRYNNEQIMNLLRDIEFKNNGYEYEQTVKYAETLEKLEFYKEKCALQGFIENIKSYVSELTKCSEDEYNFWIEAIENEIKNAMYYIPKNYEYELQLILK